MLRRRTVVRSLAALGTLAVAPPIRAEIPRVAGLRKTVVPRLRRRYDDVGLSYPPARVFLRAFKHERELELWASDRKGDAMTLVRTIPICAISGVLGPKRRQGDLQIPEGCYTIHRYNGWSAYHLALRVDYPNASDRVRGHRGNLGGAIMVHGDCVTIGCIPIEDEPIEEVFFSCLDARTGTGVRPAIHIFPTRMDDAGMERLRAHASGDPDLLAFWEELRPIYAAFEEDARVPAFEIEATSGAYRLERAST